jgi:hypothetical protein
LTRPVTPAAAELGIDPESLAWRRSSGGQGAIEVAFTSASGQDWVLLRVSADPGARVSVFSRFEWDCFLDGARNGEFDDAAT